MDGETISSTNFLLPYTIRLGNVTKVYKWRIKIEKAGNNKLTECVSRKKYIYILYREK